MKKVSVVIPSYQRTEDQSYLDLALASLKNQTYPHLEVIVSSSGVCPKIDVFKHTHQEVQCRFSKAVNAGIRLIAEDSSYVFLMNDDVILSKYCIERMVQQMGNNPWIMNPASNCDVGFHYSANFLVPKGDKWIELPRQIRKEELFQNLSAQDLMEYDPSYPLMIPTKIPSVLCFYATLFKMEVIKKIGLFDETYFNGCEDVDYMMRYEREFGQSGYTYFGAFAFHFSGITSSVIMKQEEKKADYAYLQEKAKTLGYDLS